MKNFKIISETRNPLFKRKELEASVEAEITPGRYEVKLTLAKQLKIPEDQIKIKNVLGRYGSKIFNISANVYDTIEDRDYTEPKTDKEKKDEAQAKVVEEKAKEEAAAKEPAKEEVAEDTAPKEEAAQPAEAAPVEAEKPAEEKPVEANA